MALDTAVFCFPKTSAKSCVPSVKEPPSRNTAGSSIVPSGTTDTLARRTCLFSIGVPVVPAQSIGYLRVGTKALIHNLLKFTAAELNDSSRLKRVSHLAPKLSLTLEITGWLEAGEARCKPVRVHGLVSSCVQSSKSSKTQIFEWRTTLHKPMTY